jgi:hypothetical protein
VNLRIDASNFEELIEVKANLLFPVVCTIDMCWSFYVCSLSAFSLHLIGVPCSDE